MASPPRFLGILNDAQEELLFSFNETNEDALNCCDPLSINDSSQQQIPLAQQVKVHLNSSESVDTISLMDIQQSLIRTPQSINNTQAPTSHQYQMILPPPHNDPLEVQQHNNLSFNNTYENNNHSYSTSESVYESDDIQQQLNNYASTKKKRGRPRTNRVGQYKPRPIQSRSFQVSKPTTAAPTNNIYTNLNNPSLIYPDRGVSCTSRNPVNNVSLLGQQYSNLLNDTASSTLSSLSSLSSSSTLSSLSTLKSSSTLSSLPTLSSSSTTNVRTAIPSRNKDQYDIDTIYGDEKENQLHYDPKKWKINHVAIFIEQITDKNVAEIFKQNEVDGEALLLLDKDDLRKDMQIKLGPSVKILNEIKALRERQ